MIEQPQGFRSLSDWCERYVGQDEPVADVIDLEELFVLRCKNFLAERSEHGFSLSNYHPKTTPDLLIGEENDFGAKAYVSANCDTIKINSGTLTFFLWACLKCVMDPKFPFPGPDEQPPSAKRMKGRNTISLHAFDVPAFPARRALAIELAFLCFVFVVCHEVGHLAQGHCAHIKKVFHDYGSGEEVASTHSSNAESDAKEVDSKLPLSNEERCALEFMADQFAARELLIYIKSVREAVFPGESQQDGRSKCLVTEASRSEISEAKNHGASLTARGQAVHFCYADPLFAPIIPYIIFAVVFHFTSSTSQRHPDADVRLLASLRACHELIPVVWNVTKSREMFEIGVALQRIVDNVLIAGAPDGTDGWRGLESLQPCVIDRVSSEVTRMHFLRKKLEPLLRPDSQGKNAFLQYAEDHL